MELRNENVPTPEKTKDTPQIFICSDCGGSMRYDLGSRKLICSSCKTELSIDSLVDIIRSFD